MADTDQFVIKCHAAPKVFIDGSDDAAGKFTLHEDTGNKSGTITIKGSEATGTARWWYVANRTVGQNDTQIINDGQAYTDGTAVDEDADFIMGVYIRHRGLTPNGAVATKAVTFQIQNDVGPQGPSLMLLPGESVALRFGNTAEGQGDSEVFLEELEIETGATSGGDANLATVEVLAFCDDVSG